MKTLLPKMVHITSLLQGYSSRIHIWIIRSSNLVFSMETSVYYSSYQCFKEMESQYFTCLLVLQIVFNIQLTLPLHRQNNICNYIHHFNGKRDFFIFWIFFVTLNSLIRHHEFYGNTQTRETKQETLYFFIISRKFSSGSKIKPWPFRFP